MHRDSGATIMELRDFAVNVSLPELDNADDYVETDPVTVLGNLRGELKPGRNYDTLMISEEDSLLGFVNEMERRVKGRSYYVSPEALETALLSDFIRNKRAILRV
jgi:uncharacterized protein with von Willebrand factor type A (vWA) domain